MASRTPIAIPIAPLTKTAKQSSITLAQQTLDNVNGHRIERTIIPDVWERRGIAINVHNTNAGASITATVKAGEWPYATNNKPDTVITIGQSATVDLAASLGVSSVEALASQYARDASGSIEIDLSAASGTIQVVLGARSYPAGVTDTNWAE